MTSSRKTETEQTEVEALRAQVAALQDQVAAQSAFINRIVAWTQERTYWLERWHLDLDAVMRKPGVPQAVAAARVARGGMRRLKHAQRRIAARRS